MFKNYTRDRNPGLGPPRITTADMPTWTNPDSTTLQDKGRVGLWDKTKSLNCLHLEIHYAVFTSVVFFIMALERITQSPSIVSADFLRLPGTFGSALIYRVKLRPCASAPVLMGALSTEKE